MPFIDGPSSLRWPFSVRNPLTLHTMLNDPGMVLNILQGDSLLRIEDKEL